MHAVMSFSLLWALSFGSSAAMRARHSSSNSTGESFFSAIAALAAANCAGCKAYGTDTCAALAYGSRKPTMFIAALTGPVTLLACTLTVALALLKLVRHEQEAAAASARLQWLRAQLEEQIRLVTAGAEPSLSPEVLDKLLDAVSARSRTLPHAPARSRTLPLAPLPEAPIFRLPPRGGRACAQLTDMALVRSARSALVNAGFMHGRAAPPHARVFGARCEGALR